jgi:tight adherence protein C
MIVVLVLLAGLTAALGVYALLAHAPAGERYLRYANLPGVAAPPVPRPLEAGLARLGPWLERWAPARHLERIRAQLRAAGLYSSAGVHLYLLAQLALALGGLALGHMLGGKNAAAMAVALGVAGILAVPAWLSQRARRRRAEIDQALPDALDMLTACVEAGLGLDAAIAHVARRPGQASQALGQELMRYLQELQMGVARADALRNLGQRAGVDDLGTVVGALTQGDALGVGVAQILRAQAGFLRLRRKQRAEERAMKAPIKILFPLLFGIFPALFVVLLGPAALRVWDNLIANP